jgi:hypothetical protein
MLNCADAGRLASIAVSRHRSTDIFTRVTVDMSHLKWKYPGAPTRR